MRLPAELMQEVWEHFEVYEAREWLVLLSCSSMSCTERPETFSLMQQVEALYSMTLPHLYRNISGEHFASEKFSRTIVAKPRYARFVKQVKWLISLAVYSRGRNDRSEYSPSRHYAHLEKSLGLLALLSKATSLAIAFQVTSQSATENWPEDLTAVLPFTFLPSSLQAGRHSLPKVSKIELDEVILGGPEDNAVIIANMLQSQQDWSRLKSLLCPDTVEILSLHNPRFKSHASDIPTWANVKTLTVTIPLWDFGVMMNIGKLIRDCPVLKHLVLVFTRMPIRLDSLLQYTFGERPVDCLTSVTLIDVSFTRPETTSALNVIFPSCCSMTLEFRQMSFEAFVNLFQTSQAPWNSLEHLALVFRTAPPYDMTFGDLITLHDLIQPFTQSNLFLAMKSYTLSCGLGDDLDRLEKSLAIVHEGYCDWDESIEKVHQAVIERFSQAMSNAPDQLEVTYNCLQEESFEGIRIKSLKATGGGEVNVEWRTV